MRYAIVPCLLTLLSPSLASADYALVMDKSICQDQTMSFYVIWAQQKISGKPKLFYYDGKFTAIDHTDKLDGFSTVYVAYHGSPGEAAADKTSDKFAADFKKDHSTTPKEVNFLACSSAAKGTGKYSAVGALANEYPGKTPGSTLIEKLTGSSVGCALAKVDKTTAGKIGDAVLYEKNQRTKAGLDLIKKLTDGWSKDTYPGSSTAEKFDKYCENVVMKDTSKLHSFVNEVDKQFGADYLKLINDNHGGSAIYTCGSNETQKTCQ